VFLEWGELTILDAVRATGYHNGYIRRVVRPPFYRRVRVSGQGRSKAVVWALAEQPDAFRKA